MLFRKSNLETTVQIFAVSTDMHKCSICDYTCAVFRNLKTHTHIQAVHEEVKPNKCSICNKTFSLESNLKWHIKSERNISNNNLTLLLFRRSNLETTVQMCAVPTDMLRWQSLTKISAFLDHLPTTPDWHFWRIIPLLLQREICIPLTFPVTPTYLDLST